MVLSKKKHDDRLQKAVPFSTPETYNSSFDHHQNKNPLMNSEQATVLLLSDILEELREIKRVLKKEV